MKPQSGESKESEFPTAQGDTVPAGHVHCWHERRDAASYCCGCEDLPHTAQGEAEVPAERVVTEHAKSYKKHLYERLQSVEEIAGYLEAAMEEEDHATIRLAVRDVINARDLSATTAAQKDSERAWPTRDTLNRLADAADHLLHHHNCDCDGYEEIMAARDSARELVALPVPVSEQAQPDTPVSQPMRRCPSCGNLFRYPPTDEQRETCAWCTAYPERVEKSPCHNMPVIMGHCLLCKQPVAERVEKI